MVVPRAVVVVVPWGHVQMVPVNLQRGSVVVDVAGVVVDVAGTVRRSVALIHGGIALVSRSVGLVIGTTAWSRNGNVLRSVVVAGCRIDMATVVAPTVAVGVPTTIVPTVTTAVVTTTMPPMMAVLRERSSRTEGQDTNDCDH